MKKKVVLKLIRFYQIFISPFWSRSCRFYPSCSEYALRTIEKYGVFKGGLKSLRRIFSCQPFNKGGVDLP